MLKSLLAALFAPQVEATIMITGFFREESVYILQNFVRGWGYPGYFRTVSKSLVRIELQGREESLKNAIDKLATHPLVATDHTLSVSFGPPRQKFTSFNIAFS